MFTWFICLIVTLSHHRTNREAALSELGREQVEKASQKLLEDGIQLTIMRYSLAAAAVDSANIVGNILKVIIYSYIILFEKNGNYSTLSFHIL